MVPARARAISVLLSANRRSIAIERRFAESKTEIARARAGTTYDAFVVNDTLPQAIDEVAAIVATRFAGARKNG